MFNLYTLGLPDNRQVSKDTVFYLTAKDSENWAPVTKTDTLVFESGDRFEYSNPAYNGLALIVEQVSGMKWQKFIEENIFKPSGMNTSTITDGPHPATGVSHAYNKIAGGCGLKQLDGTQKNISELQRMFLLIGIKT